MKRMIACEGLEFAAIAIVFSVIVNVPIRKIIYVYFNKYSAGYRMFCLKDIIGMILMLCVCAIVSRKVFVKVNYEKNYR